MQKEALEALIRDLPLRLESLTDEEEFYMALMRVRQQVACKASWNPCSCWPSQRDEDIIPAATTSCLFLFCAALRSAECTSAAARHRTQMPQPC